ncbi:MAG: transporter substrate-binding domain-containing protein [Sphaerochaeta sp.]|nr:transporter substrate-binding domain-containing protein [Sphaerochaeta sp.]
MQKIQKLFVVFVLLFTSGFLLAQGAREDSSTQQIPKQQVKQVLAAHTQTYIPYGYIDEKGQSDGFEIAVLRAVDSLLPQYSFTFIGTSDDDLLIGIETGKYALGTKGAWVTEERKQKFLFPKHNIGASIIGLTYRNSDSQSIKDIDSFAKYSGKLVPIAPQSAQYAVIQAYNEEHPNQPIKLVPSESFIINDAYAWVLEGRYDAFLEIALSFQNNVLKEGAPYHNLASKLAYVPYRAIPTWPLFNKGQVALAEAYDQAIEQLQQDGTIARLSEQYFGEDIFRYIQE